MRGETTAMRACAGIVQLASFALLLTPIALHGDSAPEWWNATVGGAALLVLSALAIGAVQQGETRGFSHVCAAMAVVAACVAGFVAWNGSSGAYAALVGASGVAAALAASAAGLLAARATRRHALLRPDAVPRRDEAQDLEQSP